MSCISPNVVAGGNTPSPFGFTGELHSEGLVYLRARWYDPSGGTFTARDPFAGFPQQPYSLHYYQYGYSDPILRTDASGKYPDYGNSAPGLENWSLVRIWRKEIKKTAEHHARGLAGFTSKAFAAMMAAHIAREHGFPPYNQAGDLAYTIPKHIPAIEPRVPSSTGIGNLGFYYFDKAYDHHQEGWLTDLESCVGDVNNQYTVTEALMENESFSLDLLGMWIRQRIEEIMAKQLEPTIFNVGQAIFSEGLVSPKSYWQGIVDNIGWTGFESSSANGGVRYVHGLAILQTVDKAAEMLGYSGELTRADAKPYFTSDDPLLDESVFVECQPRGFNETFWRQTPIPGYSDKCGPPEMDKKRFLDRYGETLDELKVNIDRLEDMAELPDFYDRYR